MNNKTFKLNLQGKELIVEQKNLAEQANGSIFVRCGDTLIMTTAVMGKEPKEDLGFFPLTVDYEEKYYAAGKIKGSRFIKRRGRPSDEAVCNARLIDRAIRPQFPKGFMTEVQVITTILSWDGENDPDILGLIAASTALSISDIPWKGPLSAVRIARKEGKYILNPTYKEKEDCDLDIVFTGGIKDGELLINMIEGNFEEVDEKAILEAYQTAKKALKEIIDFQEDIKKKIGKEKISFQTLSYPELEKEIKKILKEKLEKTVFQKDKEKRSEDLDKLKEEVGLFIEEKYPEEEKVNYSLRFMDEEIDSSIHENIIQYDKRADGRKLDQVRDLYCEVGLLPRTHGSGLFCRGKTKALSVLTLGAPGKSQLLDGMEITGKKRFMHHYNFPPYSAGEVKYLRGPGRREIGHGTLAEKALLPIIPKVEEFPYTIRIVSEILSSNGSTSMASVSGSSLALMDAGVPIKRATAGIAMGLVRDKESKKYKLLTDIQGPEDHYGDMDFKVAGTKQGITAIQMDVKIDGITEEIMEKALSGAKKARLEILDSMKKVLDKPRVHLSPYAPQILTIQIDPEKIGGVIGPAGKTINKIIDETGAEIDIEDSGKIFITAEKEEAAKKAVLRIKNLTREVKAGEVFQGKVTKILNFGAFVELFPGQEGLIHISKLGPGRTEKVEDVVKKGDIVSVKVLSANGEGKIDLILLKNKNK